MLRVWTGGNGCFSAPVRAPGTLSCSLSGWFFPESGAVSSWPTLINVLPYPHSQPLLMSRLLFPSSSVLSVFVCPTNSSHLDFLRFPTPSPQFRVSTGLWVTPSCSRAWNSLRAVSVRNRRIYFICFPSFINHCCLRSRFLETIVL